MINPMRLRALFVVAAISVLAVTAVACGSDTPAAQLEPTETSTPVPTATPTPEHTPTAAPTEEPHDHSTHEHGPVETGNMSVDVKLELDAMKGVNVQIIPAGFKFTPENVNQDDVDGEGHAHIYVDGVKWGRVYTPWVHLTGLEPGEHTIDVTLNSNTHGDYTSSGVPVIARETITIPEPETGMEHGHSEHRTVEATEPMNVEISALPDAMAGANVFLTVDGFVFTPENANGEHVDGEGHAHIYVDGQKIGRLYGTAIHLGSLSEGMHEIRVTLNANDHADYTVRGEIVEAVTTVHVEKGGTMTEAALDESHDDEHMHDDDPVEEVAMEATAESEESEAVPAESSGN